MDPIIGTIIVAIITGVFSVITLKVQKNQNLLIKKIDEQTLLIDKEKEVRQRLVQAEKKRDMVVEQMTILSMKVNIHLLDALAQVDGRIAEDLKQTSSELEAAYKNASDHVKEISKEYEILINVATEVQKELDKIHADRKRKP